MIRVLHVCSGLDPRAGGPPAVVVGLARSQAQAGLQVRVVSTWSEGAVNSAAETLQSQGIGVTLIGPARGPLQRHPDLTTTIESLVADSDVVHIHAVWEEIQHCAARTCQRHDVPYVITPHGLLDFWSLGRKRIKKYLYLLWRLRKNLRHAAAIHCSSEAEASEVMASGFVRQVFVEPFGIDLDDFASLPQRGAFREQHGIAGEQLVLTFLGRIHPGKGLEYLVPALGKLACNDVTLVIVGPDSQGFRATIEAAVSANGLNGRTIFTGMLRGRDKVAALVDSDLFGLPSEHENFGMAVVEALAAGCPVIVSDRVGLGQQIRDAGVGGVAALGIEPLALELRRWIENRELRASASLRARTFAMETYDWKRIARDWVGHYQTMLKRISTPPRSSKRRRDCLKRDDGNRTFHRSPLVPTGKQGARKLTQGKKSRRFRSPSREDNQALSIDWCAVAASGGVGRLVKSARRGFCSSYSPVLVFVASLAMTRPNAVLTAIGESPTLLPTVGPW